MLKNLLLASTLLLAIAGCDNRNSNPTPGPDSEIEIRSSNGTTVISRADNKGAITMDIGDQRQLYIYRVVRTGTVNPVFNNVTDLADFNFSNTTVASMDANGRLTALAAGFTTLEVVYREDNNPGNDDAVSLDITVLP
jgi:hypothetical protein